LTGNNVCKIAIYCDLLPVKHTENGHKGNVGKNHPHAQYQRHLKKLKGLFSAPDKSGYCVQFVPNIQNTWIF